MSTYSNQLIKELVENHMGSYLISLYENLRYTLIYPKYAFGGQDIHSFVSDTMDIYFKGFTSYSDLAPIILDLKKMRNNKKQYLFTSYKRKLEKQTTGLTERLISLQLEDCKAWSGDKKSLLSSFPGIDSLSAKKKIELLSLDFILKIWEYIENKLGGNIAAFQGGYPQELVDVPLFSPSPFKMTMEKVSSELYRTVITNEDGGLMIAETTEHSSPFKALSRDALVALRLLISKMCINPSGIETINISIREVAEALVSYKINDSVLDRAEEALLALSRYHYKYHGKGGIRKLEFNLLDYVLIDEIGGSRNATIIMGKFITEAVVSHKLISVADSDYRQLENSLSKILCFTLKKEQIMIYPKQKAEYTYEFFCGCVLFEKKNRKANLEAIKQSLQEFVDNGIIIEEFKYERNRFLIKFLPLTQEELDDINS